MKTQHLILAMLTALTSACAATNTSYTSTGYLADVPTPGLFFTNDSGRISLKGNVQIVNVQGTNPLITGRRLVITEAAYQEDGTAVLQGTAYQEVGSWDLTEPQNPVFKATGGQWEMNWRGLMQVDNSMELKGVGHGCGGKIEGMRLEETLTRSSGELLNPAIAYVYTGIIKPAPINANEVIENFDDDKLTGWNSLSSNGRGTLTETDHMLKIQGIWTGLGGDMRNTWCKGWRSKNWQVADGQTLEWRVDLVQRNPYVTSVNLEPASWATVTSYELMRSKEGVAICKWIAASSSMIFFSYEKVAIKNTNIVMSLAMTRSGNNLALTGRLLDKDNQYAVLYERSVVDTPGIDPTAKQPFDSDLVGAGNPDVKGLPLFAGDSINMKLLQNNYDYKQPAAEAIFDNLELRTYEVARPVIQRTVEVIWPTMSGLNQTLESATTLLGPWLQVKEQSLPGFNRMTVPMDSNMQVIRLRQSP